MESHTHDPQAVWFRTPNSLYVVHPSQRRIRRVVGINAPTLRQGDTWRSYVALAPWPPRIGHPVLIVYEIDGPTLRTTLTSPVTDTTWN